MTMTSIKNDYGETIVGILNKKSIEDNKLVLILHGEQGNSNVPCLPHCHLLNISPLGHKDSLYQVSLAEKLPYSSFRFDFSGHGDSEGQPGYHLIAVKFFF
jgi:hypothetical protein